MNKLIMTLLTTVLLASGNIALAASYTHDTAGSYSGNKGGHSHDNKTGNTVGNSDDNKTGNPIGHSGGKG